MCICGGQRIPLWSWFSLPLLCVFLVLNSDHHACEQVPSLLSHLIGPPPSFKTNKSYFTHSTFTLTNLCLNLKVHFCSFIKVTKIYCLNKKIRCSNFTYKESQGKVLIVGCGLSIYFIRDFYNKNRFLETYLTCFKLFQS